MELFRRKMCFARCLGALVVAWLCGSVSAAWAADSKTENSLFGLGAVVLVEGKHVQSIGDVGDEQVASVVSRQEMLRFNRDDVAESLNLLSGVTLSTNSRNERTIFVRGFDSRQVPLYIDGIPIYVPYDGYVDFGRFTTADLAGIQVSKGFSSVAYGPNALGGAINLLSRKPRHALEMDVSAGWSSGDSWQTALNVGTNQGWGYLQAGASYSNSTGFPLSSDFESTATEGGGYRNNAYREDDKVSIKLGLTPDNGDEYALSYYKQNGEKGQPPSTDPASARYWQWPFWDKEGFNFVSRTSLSSVESLKLRLYHDTYGNEVTSFTDGSYSKLKKTGKGSVSTGRSIYNDSANGGSIELESLRFRAQTLRFVTHYKQDEHIETDANSQKNADYKDVLLSFGIEDTIQIRPNLALSLGMSRHQLRPKHVYSRGNPYSKPDKTTAYDAQAGLFYDWSENARLYATVARKTRIPTLKDRYSQRLGTYIENPALGAEESLNYEIGYQGTPWEGGKVEAAIFYSDITDKIQSVANVLGIKSQMQNVGKVRMVGAELGASGQVLEWLEIGGSYTFIDLENRSDSSQRLTDVPQHKAIAYTILSPLPRLDVIAFAEYNSSRWASNTVKLPGFATLDLKVAYEALPNLIVEAGVTNLADRNYELADGFPSPGRMWFANATYKFSLDQEKNNASK